MTTYASVFARLRALAGNPAMTCTKPRTAWTSLVPSGYAYDADYDRFVNSSGTVWDETTATLPTDTVNILPGSGIMALDMAAGGLVDMGDRMIRILPGDLSTVQNAHKITLDGETWDVQNVTPFPAGAAMWYSVTLRKR